jgi:hypothetical protein
MSLSAERAEDKALAEDLAKGITRERRAVQDGAGVGAAPPAGRGGRGGRGRGTGAPGAPEATGERDQER